MRLPLAPGCTLFRSFRARPQPPIWSMHAARRWEWLRRGTATRAHAEGSLAGNGGIKISGRHGRTSRRRAAAPRSCGAWRRMECWGTAAGVVGRGGAWLRRRGRLVREACQARARGSGARRRVHGGGAERFAWCGCKPKEEDKRRGWGWHVGGPTSLTPHVMGVWTPRDERIERPPNRRLGRAGSPGGIRSFPFQIFSSDPKH
jgi:hypothetical protein